MVAGVALVLGAALPAHAGSQSGSIALPIVTPQIPREAYNLGLPVGSFAAVIKLPANADGRTYTLTKTSGFGQLDAYFYTDAGGSVGSICNPIPNEPPAELLDDDEETGVICPGAPTAGWAIVILRWGANASFTLSW